MGSRAGDRWRWVAGSTCRALIGAASAVALAAALAAVMVPIRSHLSVATTALVLVVPVVVGVAIGGFSAGVIATAAGFLVYDYLFIPPYNTLSVGAAQDWTALGVYVIVMIVVAQVVTRMNVARAAAQQRATEVRRLFDLSELLVRDSLMADLLDAIVSSVVSAFDVDGAALLLPHGEHLELAASAGVPLSDEELRQLTIAAGVPVSVESAGVARGAVRTVALAPSGRAIGLLALRNLPGAKGGHELLRAFANHLALALERAQLREQAVHVHLLQQVDQLRRSLVGAVSHDLRTPLATMKVAASTLLDPDCRVDPNDAYELLELIDTQVDRLDRLVGDLLDMTRIQAGVLEMRRKPTSIAALIADAVSLLGGSGETERVVSEAGTDLPLVDVDPVLVTQALANLIDNATRYSPADTVVTISADRLDVGSVRVAIVDRGPGVTLGALVATARHDPGGGSGGPSDSPSGLFEMLERREAGGHGGLGLAIARAFIDAHGQPMWAEGSGGGTRIAFTLPVAKES